MAKYKLYKDPIDEEGVSVKKDCGTNENGIPIKLSIPFIAGNTDYAEYLEWVDAGNTPDAAD